MSDQEALDFYNELVDYYGDKLPNFEHYPKQFAYCIKLYKYYKSRKESQ